MYHILNDKIEFPPLDQADEEGLLAIGGDLSVERLLMAYKNGIFPWYNENDPILWWSPNPRCVLFPDKIKISKSMQQTIRKNRFQFTVNKRFADVLNACQNIVRKDGIGTWIHKDMVSAYTQLHQNGFILSAETWLEDRLVGGLYGVKIANVFFGESMFSLVPDASKFALIQLCNYSMREKIQLIDCQMKTNHLLSMGAEMMDRKKFINLIEAFMNV